MTQEYWGSTAAALDHYFGNYIEMARLFHVFDTPKPSREAFEERKTKFIAGLESTIARNLPVHGGITQDHLREILQLAQGDWSDINVVKSVYDMYYQINGTKYDEKMLFPQMQ